MRISLRNNLYLWVPVLSSEWSAIVLATHGLHPPHIGVLGGDPIGPRPPDTDRLKALTAHALATERIELMAVSGSNVHPLSSVKFSKGTV